MKTMKVVAMILLGIVLDEVVSFAFSAVFLPARMPVETALKIHSDAMLVHDRRWMIATDYNPTTASFVPQLSVPQLSPPSTVEERRKLHQVLQQVLKYNCEMFDQLSLNYQRKIEEAKKYAGTGEFFQPEFRRPVKCPMK